MATARLFNRCAGAVGPLFGIPAYFNNTVYFSAAHDQVKAFALRDGLLSTVPVSASNADICRAGDRAQHLGQRRVQWNSLDHRSRRPAPRLRCCRPQRISFTREAWASYVKFSTPTIANGKVYVGTADSLVVFGLQNQAAGSVAAVVNANGFQPGPVAPGSIVSLFGSNLAPRAAQASSSPWPKVLENTSVFVNGTAAPLAYVSPTQINAQIPNDTKPGQATVTVVVRRPGFSSRRDIDQKRARGRSRYKLRCKLRR